MAEKKNDIAELSYEQARDELTRVLNELEAGSVTLEDSMKLWSVARPWPSTVKPSSQALARRLTPP